MSRAEQEIASSSSRIINIPTALFLLATLIFLYLFLFVPPFIPLGDYGDGIIYLDPGKRMFEGETMYRDFFELVPPGMAIVTFFLFKLFGPRLWIPNLEILLVGLGLAWLGVIIAKKLVRPSLALLPSAIFIVGVYGRQLDATHHWYSLLTATAAIAVLMERRTAARIATAGFLCGLTACFTQPRGFAVVVGFGAYLWWESRQRHEDGRALIKKEAWLGAGFLATLIAVNGYFIWKAGLTQFLWCTVVFVIKCYPKAGWGNTFVAFKDSFPAFGSLHNFILRYIQSLFFYALIPLTYVLFFARYWRETGKRSTEFWERPMLLAVAGFCTLLSVAPAASPYRMAASVLPGIILLVWFLDSPHKLARAFAALFAVGVVLVALNAVARERPKPNWILTAPQGKFADGDLERFEEYTWVQQHTQPLDYFFEPADTADMYFYLDLRNPTPVPYVTISGYTTPEQVTGVIQGLEQHKVRYILCRRRELGTTPGWKLPPGDNLDPLRDYIRSHYRAVKVFTNTDEIWEKEN